MEVNRELAILYDAHLMGAKKKKKFPDEPQFGEEQTHTHTAAVCKDMMMIYAVVNQQRNQKKKEKKVPASPSLRHLDPLSKKFRHIIQRQEYLNKVLF